MFNPILCAPPCACSTSHSMDQLGTSLCVHLNRRADGFCILVPALEKYFCRQECLNTNQRVNYYDLLFISTLIKQWHRGLIFLKDSSNGSVKITYHSINVKVCWSLKVRKWFSGKKGKGLNFPIFTVRATTKDKKTGKTSIEEDEILLLTKDSEDVWCKGEKRKSQMFIGR